jgi:hypothetical protein
LWNGGCEDAKRDGNCADVDQIENAMLTWAQGFMSSSNVNLDKGQYRDLAAMSLDAQKASLRNYCDEHPMAEFVKAVIDLYFKLPMKKYTPPASTFTQ